MQLSEKDWENLTENCQKISNTSDLELEVILTGNQGSGPIGGTEILDKDKKTKTFPNRKKN